MSKRIDHEARAIALIGTRFRPQGRSEGALDCLGLMIEVYAIPGDQVRRDYRLRGDHGGEIASGLKPYFRTVAAGAARAGDAVLFRIADDQFHFAVKTERGFIHAHAGIGKVVEHPGVPDWPLAGTYRRRGCAKKG